MSDKSYRSWCRIDDNNEQFLTLPRHGGPHKMTTDEDDKARKTVALENKWSSLDELRDIDSNP